MLGDKISYLATVAGQTIKSFVKLAVQSKASGIQHADIQGHPLIILGNGPSLAHNISEDMELLTANDTLAVNFAANTSAFFKIQPKYYLLMDPHFFNPKVDDMNVKKLYAGFNEKVDWDMTLFVPTNISKTTLNINNRHISIAQFNPIGVEGASWLMDFAFRKAYGMPRPRNVLIPAIMVGMWLGYKQIYLLGADHSWLKTLDVDNDNNVVSIQPHFYTDGQSEHERVAAMFKDIRLHELLWSFHLAFKGYHSIREYAEKHNIRIYNATPGSYIDAFERCDINNCM